MKKFWLKIINLLLILSALGLGLWLINQNFPSYGQLIVEPALGQDQPMISRLGPDPRVTLAADYQAILESPVYFDLRSMPWFTKARIYFVFQAVGLDLEGIGGQVGPGWQYDLQDPILVQDLGDGWQKAVFDFDLTKIYQQKNVRRFLISLQGEEGELRMKAFKIILSQ